MSAILAPAGLRAVDLSLLFGGGSGLARGQLRPSAVPLYNAVHRSAGPATLVVVGSGGALPSAWLVFGLAWALHIDALAARARQPVPAAAPHEDAGVSR